MTAMTLPATVRRVRPTWLRELGVVAGLYVAYSAGRLLAGDDLTAAVRHGQSLLHVEAWTGLDVERALNHAVLAVPLVAIAASYWYALLHYAVTPAVLVWLYRRRPEAYGRWRTALVVTSLVGLVGFWLLPTAPPRLLPHGGFVDVLARHADVGWWGGDASAPKGLGGLTNQFAAMPSLHVGWSVWVAAAVVAQGRHRLRFLALGYPLLTALVVVGTGNHYLVDVLAGAAVAAAGVAVARAAGQRADQPRTSRGTTSTTGPGGRAVSYCR